MSNSKKLEALFKLQTDAKISINKAQLNYKKSPKDRITQSYLETRLEALEKQWNSFVENHRSIIEIATDSNHEYFDTDLYDSTEENYILYKSALKEQMSTLVRPVNVTEIQTSKIKSNVRLPKITIPTFSGTYSEWTSFRDMFTSLIHKNNDLDDVQKLHYLKGHLTGEAEQLLRHTPVTAANYLECWQTLVKRYDNKRFLCNSMLTKLINQPKAPESSSGIRELLDTTVDCMHGLSTIGINVDSWDAIVIYIISAKLDSESRRLWETQISSGDDLPKFYHFKEFLESRFRSLEYLDSTSNKVKATVSRQRVLHAVDSQTVNRYEIICPFCKQAHRLSNCKQFSKNDYQTRSDFVRTQGLCYNCLGSNHSIKFCRVSTTCQICKRRHHSLLHPKGSSESASSSGHSETVKSAVSTLDTDFGEVQESEVHTMATHFSKKTVPVRVLLATAVVEAQTKYGDKHMLRALLDQGSQASLITESAVQLLGLKKSPAKGRISGVGGNNTMMSKYIVTLTIYSRHDPRFSLKVQAYVLSKITSFIPSDKVSIPTGPQFEGLTLADPKYHTPNKIDVLLGAEVYSQILREGLIKHSPGLIAQNTHLGWILSGQMSSVQHDTNVVCAHSQITEDEILKRFWEIESEVVCPKRKILTEEEKFCEKFFSETTERDITGRYIVKLPFKEPDPQCQYGHTRDVALKRFHLLERRFKRDTNLKEKYKEVINEYISLGHMVEISRETDTKREKAVYLPHHAVVREDKTTTKVRVVFDASSKGSNGISLNDCLRVGPTIQPDLRRIIMKWRWHSIVLCADIVKMYRQVKIAPEDTDFQRLLWRSDDTSEIKDYKLLRVTFGTACAPYLAVRSMQQLAHDEQQEFPMIAEKIKEEYYVDDFMSGCQSVEEGVRIYKDMNRLMAKGGFELQKWMTNNKELAREIKEDRDHQDGVVELRMDEVMKILGIHWDRECDSFKYSVALPSKTGSETKRTVISDISRLFDPLGWVAPCVVPAKIFIQKLWLAGIDWDDGLPAELLSEWKTYQSDLLHLPEIVIPRWLETTTNSTVELHGFCDASNLAYAAVVYLRVIDGDDSVKVNLITAKTKVAPTKQISIPRLELMGAVLLAKLIIEVADIFMIERDKVHCWTDSSVVLAWLSGHPSRWTTFVGNRVSDIFSYVENSQWAHVRSPFNPADIASRGMKPLELAQSSMWFHGPLWLKNKVIDYPKLKFLSTNLEVRSVKVHHGLSAIVCHDNQLWTKFSSLHKLIRVVAYCRRVLKKNRKSHTYLTSEELQSALEICIKRTQEDEFTEDINKIKKEGKVSKKK